ncbi:MAG: hypothetical protein Q9183_006407 [Haloplaca sp. 2 TL-2023]
MAMGIPEYVYKILQANVQLPHPLTEPLTLPRTAEDDDKRYAQLYPAKYIEDGLARLLATMGEAPDAVWLVKLRNTKLAYDGATGPQVNMSNEVHRVHLFCDTITGADVEGVMKIERDDVAVQKWYDPVQWGPGLRALRKERWLV